MGDLLTHHSLTHHSGRKHIYQIAEELVGTITPIVFLVNENSGKINENIEMVRSSTIEEKCITKDANKQSFLKQDLLLYQSN